MSTPTVPTAADLARDVRGPVLTRGDAGYAEETAGFNPLAARSPEVVVGVTCVADVVAAVRWAAERGMPVGVQATGHGWAAGSGEVLALVAAGSSNRDIADRLVLSVRTVEHHIASLLRRTGVRDRGGLAALVG